MKIDRIVSFYFSPNGTTRALCRSIGNTISSALNVKNKEIDFTLPQARKTCPEFDAGTLVIAASPVYAGRLPNLLLPYLEGLKGNGALAIPIAVFGNRAPDQTLTEWKRLLTARGFIVPAAASFVGQHSFSVTLAAGRPDSEDMKRASQFAMEIADRLPTWTEKSEAVLPFDGQPLQYYRPQRRDGTALNFLRAKPDVSDACIQCGACASVCPMGAIALQDARLYCGPCIKCNACIRICPNGARRFIDPDYLYHKEDLEQSCSERKEVSFYFA